MASVTPINWLLPHLVWIKTRVHFVCFEFRKIGNTGFQQDFKDKEEGLMIFLEFLVVLHGSGDPDT